MSIKTVYFPAYGLQQTGVVVENIPEIAPGSTLKSNLADGRFFVYASVHICHIRIITAP